MRSNLIEIKFDSCLPSSFDSPNQVRRSGEIFQLFGKNQGSIPHLAERIKRSALLAIPNFAKAVSSLAARLLSRCKQIDLIYFQIFRAIIPLFLLINSLPDAYTEKAGKKERRDG